jgi:hypothetical protein
MRILLNGCMASLRRDTNPDGFSFWDAKLLVLLDYPHPLEMALDLLTS